MLMKHVMASVFDPETGEEWKAICDTWSDAKRQGNSKARSLQRREAKRQNARAEPKEAKRQTQTVSLLRTDQNSETSAMITCPEKNCPSPYLRRWIGVVRNRRQTVIWSAPVSSRLSDQKGGTTIGLHMSPSSLPPNPGHVRSGIDTETRGSDPFFSGFRYCRGPARCG
jgi:hypothetical protein